MSDEDHGQSTDGDEQGTKEAPAVGETEAPGIGGWHQTIAVAVAAVFRAYADCSGVAGGGAGAGVDADPTQAVGVDVAKKRINNR